MGLLRDLAAQVSTQAKIIEDALATRNLPLPSFAADSPTKLPDSSEYGDLQEARNALIDAARSIEHLATGPEQWMKFQLVTLSGDQVALSVLAHFDFFSAVPLHGEVSYADIAANVKLPEDRVRRFIRQAMTNHIFTEPRPGFVAHTASSAAAIKIPAIKTLIEFFSEECCTASLKTVDAMKKWGASEEPARSGYGVAMGLNPDDDKDCVFRFAQEDGEGENKGFRLKRIGEAMEALKETGAYRVEHVQRGFDWAGLGNATVVDLGGSVGHLSIEIASQNPNITCIVQDFPALRPGFEASLPKALASRVSFQEHDIFTAQPVQHADVYIFRLILHDWPDAYCIPIIQQLVPAMKKGSRILAIDCIIERWSDVKSLALDRLKIGHDMFTMAMMNGKERTEEDWKALFAKASPELEVRSLRTLEGSALGFVEIVKI